MVRLSDGENMRKITFKINDRLYLERDFKKQNPEISEKQLKDIFDNIKPFIATYILYGNEYPDRYELFNQNGEKMYINDLNNYERACIISRCDNYYNNHSIEPDGVVEIIEE